MCEKMTQTLYALLSNFGKGGDCNVDDKYFVFTRLNTNVKYNEQICHTQVFFSWSLMKWRSNKQVIGWGQVY